MVPGQALYPYMKNTDVFRCPIDPWSDAQRLKDQLPNLNGTYGTPEERRLYSLGVRANMGYNYQFFSPWRWIPGANGTGYTCTSASSTESQIANVSGTIMYGNSIWDRDKGGNPTGGGNWVVETPCWLDENSKLMQPMAQYASGTGDGHAVELLERLGAADADADPRRLARVRRAVALSQPGLAGEHPAGPQGWARRRRDGGLVG